MTYNNVDHILKMHYAMIQKVFNVNDDERN